VVTAQLPDWHSVLAVVAHPDDESFGLGGILATFVANGARVSVLCFTHGEASTLHGVEGELAVIRSHELLDAATELGISDVFLKSYPDGALNRVDRALLEADVAEVAESVDADGFIVFDPDGVTSHPDHKRATEVAQSVAARRGRDIVAWTIPEAVAQTLNDEFDAVFIGHAPSEIDMCIPVSRDAQIRAVACHPSQATPGSVLWRRLELLGVNEHLRVLGPG
jgi:N-acetylglucosamine malate deacetylase 2